MASLLPLLGWAVLPKYATSFLLSVYYGITIRAGEPKPLPQTPRYERHRRRIFIFVITSYLLYTLYETFHQVQLAGDYYQALGVSPFADLRTIKARFRRLAIQYHPDKVGHDNGDAYFVHLRQAQETLVDPVKRFAYDRFGTDMLGWGEQETMYDFLTTSLIKSILPQYISGFVTTIVLNRLWWTKWGRFWRLFTFGAMLTLELGVITHPQAVFMPIAYLPAALQAWLPKHSYYLLPFQILTLARRASIILHIFILQSAPPSSNEKGSGDKISPQTMQRVGQLVQLTRTTDLEATRMLQLGLAPFRGDRESASSLRRGMREGLILGGVRSSPEVQRAVAQVVERRKAGSDSM
ncbi:Heat shock protein DnaJ N-terminal [Penicillium paradoxum]|uniref:Heat shock protein DnaJ N-terminal n=1 Tax=Penicillium paradoxum TaxID=176176 RepID=UPI002547B118|nr:Heat shock protein DnaJ N-terminal [Penicillium paradoxum]KAJ5782127.1 Heat shock protein DnaJ N-terminal [Penicillium paradoxum]